MHLHFIAIVAPDHINQQVLAWKQYMLQQYNCKVALKSPAHITLIPPFQMPDADRNDLTEILNRFAPLQNNFTIQVKDFDAFKPRVIFVHVQSNPLLQALKIKLENELLQANRFRIEKEERPFHPHITIANRDLKKENFPEAWQHFKQLSYEATFMADHIALLRHNETKNWDVVERIRLKIERE